MNGNGVDLGAIYQAIVAVAADVRTVAADVRELRREMANKADRSDVADLRRAVDDYHNAVIGHGVLISELDERVSRLEQSREPPEAAE